MESGEVENQAIPASFHCVTQRRNISQTTKLVGTERLIRGTQPQCCQINYLPGKPHGN